MDCRCVQEKISLYLDGVLDEATLEAVETHTASCTECRMELEAMRVLVEATGHVDEVEPPAYLRSSIMQLVRQEAESSADVQQTSILVKVAEWVGGNPVKKLSWAAAGAVATAVFAGVMITDKPNKQVEKVAVKPVPPVVRQVETVVPEVEKTEVAITPEKAVAGSIVRNKPSVRMSYAPKTLQKRDVDIRQPMHDVYSKPVKTQPQKHVNKPEPEVAATHKSDDPEASEVLEGVDKEAVVPEVKTVGNNSATEPALIKPAKEEQASSHMELADAPLNPSRDMHEWVESVKQEFAVKRQYKSNSTIQLFDKKF